MVVSQIPKVIGFIYALVMIGVIAYLWYSGRWRQKLGWLLLVISAFLGFLIFSPVAPWQFQQLVLGDVQGLGAPLIVGRHRALDSVSADVYFREVFLRVSLPGRYRTGDSLPRYRFPRSTCGRRMRLLW